MTQSFIPASSFDALAAKGRRVEITSWGTWFPVFDNEEDALAFARYVGGFARRVVERASTRAFAQWSDKHSAFLSVLSIQFPGWGREEGPVMCAGNQVSGVAIRHDGKVVLLPVKQHKYTARTKSGSLYIGFMDGTAFCRSLSDGPQILAKALYFARSSTDAEIVQERGGELQVSTTPTVGAYPLYVTGSEPKPGARGGFVFARASFRLGTKVETVTPA
ncbi:MAG TPA: hypothetical protein PLI59_09160 [Candidatus Obscuribacter sp.]|nr:hypothetical protein [Candidatus Melainabacteria bacterium]HNG19334.1 hypothetical protein [Candidatus Obscuribacter sp.]HNG74850.1 hypothetical protein [Candidatus Obscuribacter sp.]